MNDLLKILTESTTMLAPNFLSMNNFAKNSRLYTRYVVIAVIAIEIFIELTANANQTLLSLSISIKCLLAHIR